MENIYVQFFYHFLLFLQLSSPKQQKKKIETE